MTMDEVSYCNIHTSGSIGVNCIATKLYLGGGTTLGFLWVKELAWSSAFGSATAEIGTLGDSPKVFRRKNR
jgi:hypothetical protein